MAKGKLMELIIEYYSKTEVSIKMNFSGPCPYDSRESNELFLFSCYTIRQFSNFGEHPVGMVLAVLLTTFDKETTTKLGNGNYQFPSPFELGMHMGLNDVKANINYEDFERQIMPGLPRFVKFRGSGKKAFTMTFSPLQLNLKGFGILGFRINYYAFQSVFAFFRCLAKNRLTDDVYIEHLSQVAKICGNLQISHKSNLFDQEAISKAILHQAGITQTDS